ncbi:MAG: DUF2550 domain-containing protein [Actinomycetales bacterium]|nr:DUF2550 domain-containing protein [Actinomycetales bacterium]
MREAIVAACVVVVLAGTLAALFLWRLRTLSHRVGSFECAMHTDGRWLAGIATYTRDHLAWYEVVSLSVRPSRRWARRELDITSRELRRLGAGTSRISEAHCTYRGEGFLLAGRDHALDGLTAWLEAAPPGPITFPVG